MGGESDFIAALQAAPSDAALIESYATWLEERGDRRAQFLRLRATVARMSPIEKQFGKLWAQLRRLRRDLDSSWLAALDRTPIDNCSVRFVFQCPKRWEALEPTEDASIRFCESCQRKVYYCATLEQARLHAKAGDCVAVDSMLNRRQGDLSSTRRKHVHVGVVGYVPKVSEDARNEVDLPARQRSGRRGSNRPRHPRESNRRGRSVTSARKRNPG
jgi:uncharacterized protein (TIGR02996 family)